MSLIKFPIETNNETFRSIDVRDLGVQQRTSNTLLRNGYRTLGDIIDNYDKLQHGKKIGAVAIKEINTAIIVAASQLFDTEWLLKKLDELNAS